MGTRNDSDASPEMVPLLSEDEITPANYGAARGADEGAAGEGEDADAESDAPKKKKKGKKTPQKEVADALKTDMAAERTFFKWLWTGLHTGAIGSFIFVTFDTDKSDPKRLVVVGFAWVVAFMLVLYGTMVYYRRRRALRSGRLEDVPRFTREHSPLVVVVALALVVGAAMTYAMVGERNKDASLPGFAP